MVLLVLRSRIIITIGEELKIIYMTCIFAIIVLAPFAAEAAYNPSSGKDDIVIIDEAQEVKMGRSLSEEVEKKFGLSKDSGMQARVNEVGQKLAKVCDRPSLTYSFRVLEGKDIEKDARFNAFALPGGYVYIFEDMIKDMKSDDELASVLAHEIGHITTRHSLKKLQASIGMAALNIIGIVAKADRNTQAKSSYAVAELMVSYSRQAELEADKLSVVYMKKAGYDPKAAVSFVDRMIERRMKGEVHRYIYFRTHPYTSERRAILNMEIEGKLEFNDYINTTDETREMAW